MAMSTAEQVVFGDSMRGGKGQDFLAGMDPKQKETLLAMNSPQARCCRNWSRPSCCARFTANDNSKK